MIGGGDGRDDTQRVNNAAVIGFASAKANFNVGLDDRCSIFHVFLENLLLHALTSADPSTLLERF